MDVIDVQVTSETAPLREAAVSPVNPAMLERSPAGAESMRASVQHARLIAILAVHGVRIHWCTPADNPAQTCPRELGFVIDDAFFLARPRFFPRLPEQQGPRDLLTRLAKVHRLPRGRIASDDVLVTEDDVLVGLTDHTDTSALAALRDCLRRAGSHRRVVPIEFGGRTRHLHGALTLVGPKVALWFPEVFLRSSRDYLESRYDLIEATAGEARSLAVSTLALAPEKVIVQSSAQRLAEEIASRGITPIPLEHTEHTRFPGGLHRSALPLVRAVR